MGRYQSIGRRGPGKRCLCRPVWPSAVTITVPAATVTGHGDPPRIAADFLRIPGHPLHRQVRVLGAGGERVLRSRR